MKNWQARFTSCVLFNRLSGNQNLHALTSCPHNPQVLRIELTKKQGESPIVMQYRKFSVGSKSENYKLTVGDYSGPDGYDALSSHNGHTFSVKKNGEHSGDHCVSQISGGWWFNGCIHSNLNGWKFKENVPETSKGLGITWYNRNDENSYFNVYSEVEMKIRDADFEFCMGSLTYEAH
ncbi:angiopoietin-related protein 7-like [Ixodes scapularis]|uniref:angiopoietin-related protein 7-like n=1 Tax=Ixodes scapularis TaxID=6945 RepID=UPI001A9FCE88|nr:angiopoietin-related protein 7-like [Ixodes scapularis]